MFSSRPARNRRTTGPHRHRRAFSLVEALIALAILAMVFTAIASAIGAGTASAGEARTRVVAALAADELLAEIIAAEPGELDAWDGYAESPGAALAPDGRAEAARKGMARHVSVTGVTRTLVPSGIEVIGRSVVIEVRSGSGRTLARLERFVPATGGVAP